MKKKDIILVLVLLIICGIAAAVFCLNKKPGDRVVVKIDGSIYGEYDINKQEVIQIPAGDGYNVLAISGGVASITDADCPDKVCVSHASIYKKGETIVCLPHKLTVVVK